MSIQLSGSFLATAPHLFINRELSWLDFNERVLAEALDPRVPLLERVNFLSIFGSNLDEFFMVRVAGLRRQVVAGVTKLPADGMSPQEQLDAISARATRLTMRANECLDGLLRELVDHGIELCTVEELDAGEWGAMDEFFEAQIFPVLTPLAVDPGHPFPYISNLSISLAVQIVDPASGEEHFARVKVPKSLPRWVPVAGRENHYVPLEQVIGTNLGALFPGMEVMGWYPFRLTRYSDLDLPAREEPEDLLASIEEQVFKRRFGEVVRVEVTNDMPPHLRRLLLEELREDEEPEALLLGEGDFVESGRLLDLSDLLQLAMLDMPELRYPPYTPGTPPELADPGRSIFDVIRERDVLVHHPFDSFTTSVERFIQSAALDEHVLAIKVALYRTTGDTAVVRALTEAAQRGKQVAVIVELKARFDEVSNITSARMLENFGVHVAYGWAMVKTHAKVAMVVRREADGIRRYIHLSSGNYNSNTARLYTDVGLVTASPSIGADVSDLFNTLTGFSRQRLYRKLVVAPSNMRDRVVELIDREAAHARAGRTGRIVAKMNALVDPTVIRALYEASGAGVEIDLIVRGICCLRPGLPEVSERIRVRSIIGRYLEHSRIWWFGNDGDDEFYVGSADWMPRNFERRVEAAAPVEDPTLHPKLRSLLELLLREERQAWTLNGAGQWSRVSADDDAPGAHHLLMLDSWGRWSASEGETEA